MTTDELKQEAEEYADKHYMKSFFAQADIYVDDKKEIINAILHFAEPREKRIAELEGKLEQTEKDLADYQFNYPTIKELEKENADLKEALKGKVCKCMIYFNFKDLEKENAELKLKLEALEGQTPWKDIKDKSEVTGQLTKAKELLAKWVELYKPKLKDFPKLPIQIDTEQFLKDSEEK